MAFLTASDNTKIAYDWYPTGSPVGYLLFMHMMPATKESWRDFAEEMRAAGFAGLAIDLRGHGQSDGGPEGFQKFSDRDHRKSILDVDAAVKFLEQQGARPEATTLIGASIGANLALQYLAEHPEFPRGVLISAGLEYHGIEALPYAARMSSNKNLFFVTSRDDSNNAAMTMSITRALPAGVRQTILGFDLGGHGTALLPQAHLAIRDFLLAP